MKKQVYMLCKEAFLLLENAKRTEEGKALLAGEEAEKRYKRAKAPFDRYKLSNTSYLLIENSVYKTLQYLQNEGFDTCDPEVCKMEFLETMDAFY